MSRDKVRQEQEEARDRLSAGSVSDEETGEAGLKAKSVGGYGADDDAVGSTEKAPVSDNGNRKLREEDPGSSLD